MQLVAKCVVKNLMDEPLIILKAKCVKPKLPGEVVQTIMPHNLFEPRSTADMFFAITIRMAADFRRGHINAVIKLIDDAGHEDSVKFLIPGRIQCYEDKVGRFARDNSTKYWERAMSLRLGVYLVGGLLLWLGVYGYMKTRGSIGFSPIPGTPADRIYQTCGKLGQIALLAYFVAMVIIFQWWIAIIFLVVGGILTGILYSRVGIFGAGLSIFVVPLGIVVSAIAIFLIDAS